MSPEAWGWEELGLGADGVGLGEPWFAGRDPQPPGRHRRSFALVFKATSTHRDPTTYDRYLASAQQQHQEMGLQ